MTHEATQTTLIVGFKTLTLVLGSLITLLAYRAYQRTGNRALGSLAAGFAIVTLGTLLAGIAHQILQTDVLVGLLIESALIAAGFLVIVYSLYTTG